jgi:vacuolar-type H+-ATPase subunit E/Vma4
MPDDAADKKEALSQRILDNARKQAQQTIDRAKQEEKKLQDEAERSGQRESEEILRNARSQAEAEAMKIAASTPRSVRRKILEAQNDILEGMLEAGLNAAVEAADKAPEEVLKALILAAALIVHEDHMVVEANEKDRARISTEALQDIAAEVKKRQGRSIAITLSDECVPIVGGVIVRARSGRMVCDNSFEARLGRSREQLRLDIAETLFNEKED